MVSAMGAIAGIVGMQVVAGIVRRLQPRRMSGVAQHRVKVEEESAQAAAQNVQPCILQTTSSHIRKKARATGCTCRHLFAKAVKSYPNLVN
jgi:hypothetical protein